MKKIVMFFGLMVISTIIFSQQKAAPRERATKQADKMKTELSLDDVQYNALKSINEEYAGKQSGVWRDSTLSKETKHQQMRKLHEEKDAAVGKVLTKDQHDKWIASRLANVEKHQAHVKKAQRDHAKQMKENLSLTDQQASKIKAIDQEFAAKFRAIKRDSAQAKSVSQDKARQLREEHRAKTKSILTEEQFSKWEAQKADRKRKKF